MPIYMQIQGIDGDVTAEGFEGWFEVFSFSWGVTNHSTGVGGGGGAGRPTFSDLSVMKPAGKGSPALFVNCASGRHFARAEVDVAMATEGSLTVFEKFLLSDCLITSYQIGGSGGERPTESLSLNFTKIEFRQLVQNSEGVFDYQHAGWDLRSNRPF